MTISSETFYLDFRGIHLLEENKESYSLGRLSVTSKVPQGSMMGLSVPLKDLDRILCSLKNGKSPSVLNRVNSCSHNKYTFLGQPLQVVHYASDLPVTISSDLKHHEEL